MTHCTLVPPLYEARINDWIRFNMLRKLGLEPVTLEELEINVAAKRDPSFDAARNLRLCIGHIRYEGTGRDFLDKIGSAIARLKEYQKTLNREHLVDACNLIEIEWCRPSVEGTYWKAEDCGGHWSLRNQ